MNVILFEARRPPVAFLVCASEGGMQRVLACSFDWITSTFYRETVLRLETPVIGRMDRIRRVRLSMQEKDD
jgi:23S rRNA C2498 (ribose-2'-O)-methylase RlmM